MISISTPTFDLDGSRVFSRTTQTVLSGLSRRVTRTATLDGKSSFYDGGCSHSDRTFEIIQDSPDQADVDFCKYITEFYSEVIVSCSEGVFSGCPSVFKIDSSGNLKLTILIKEKLNE